MADARIGKQMSSAGYDVRTIIGTSDLEQVADVARSAWGPDTEVEGPGLLRAAVDEGALLAGAFLGQRLVAYVHDFPTLDPRVRHSHRAGVHPEHRRMGLALTLKRFQADTHRSRGVELIRWTYDPLRLANARLNIAHLGAVVRRYLRNHYGDMTGVNAGTPSDRLLAEWFIQRERIDRSSVPHAPTVLRSPTDYNLELDDALVRVELPEDFERLVQTDPPLALAWRMAGRIVLETYMSRGYIVTGIDGAAYVLEQADDFEDFVYPQS